MKNNGFTLLELSIVIVIIGLIVAGISAGQSLVRQAGLRSVSTDIANFQAAKNSFKLAYDAKPGDMDNAFDYWGTDCAATDVLCNGDGYNRVEHLSQEMFRAWQHLSLADIISGSYTGTSDGIYSVIAGLNAPASDIGTGAYSMWYSTSAPPWDYIGDMMVLGAQITSGGPDNALFTVAEMQSLDSKTDDGDVYSGRIFGQDGNDVAANSCVTVGNAYNLAATGVVCKMQIAYP